MGFAAGELAPKPEAWFALIHDEDRSRFHEAFDVHVRSRGQVPFSVEVRYLTKDRTVIWVKSRGQVTDWSVDHRPLRMIGVHQNYDWKYDSVTVTEYHKIVEYDLHPTIEPVHQEYSEFLT